MSSYVYIRSEPQLWTVGFCRPDGKWESESDHGIREEAAQRAAWLNGGAHVDRLESRISVLECRVAELGMQLHDHEQASPHPEVTA